MPAEKGRQSTRNKADGATATRNSFERAEILTGPRGTRAKKAIVERSESEEDDEDELSEEDADGESDPDLEEDADADTNEVSKTKPNLPRTAARSTTIRLPKASSKATGKKEVASNDEDDDDELSSLGSDDQEAEDRDDDDDDEEEADEDEDGEEQEEDDEEESDEIDTGTGMGSRASTPDMSKLTKRQRSRWEAATGGELLQLPSEPKIKKILSAEEHAMRRAEMARRRKNLSEKRNEEEKPANDPPANGGPVQDGANLEEARGAISHDGSVAAETTAAEDISPGRIQDAGNRKGHGKNYGSAVRRAARNRKPKEVSSVRLPEWFLRNNVITADEVSVLAEDLEIFDPRPSTPAADEAPPGKGGSSDRPPNPPDSSDPKDERRYQLHKTVWMEVLATIRAGLYLPDPSHANGFFAHKVHALLQCPKDGGTFFLDTVVAKAAATVGADLIRLDGEDIAEIGEEYVDDGSLSTSQSIRSLAYDAQKAVARQDPRDIDEGAEVEAEEDEEGMEEHEDEAGSSLQGSTSPLGSRLSSKVTAIALSELPRSLVNLLTSGKVIPAFIPSHQPQRSEPSPRDSRNAVPAHETRKEKRMNEMAAAIVNAVSEKRARAKADADDAIQSDASSSSPESVRSPKATGQAEDSERPLIIMIRDFKLLRGTHQGLHFFQSLLEHISNRRIARQAILLVGTESSAALIPSLSRAGFRVVQSDSEAGPARTIIVTPPHNAIQDNVFHLDERRRMREINMRHIRDLIRERTSDPAQTAGLLSLSEIRLNSVQEYSSGLEAYVWPFDRVHRVVVTALGVLGRHDQLTPEIIGDAIRLIDSSDGIKSQWADDETEVHELPRGRLVGGPPTTKHLTLSAEERVKKLRKNCNDHEKKLLAGIIIPEHITTTFANVHVPPDTVETLKTLISLSLVRPDAFSYGVLATDQIPGLMLYGPPGTGKTLLAKAVAKESGATVLEVSGSEVYDMYVGEGEKNVKAIFTLAKKLSPCVVFIDEADAIFTSRGGASSRTTHRELINQFLREWDGMNSLSAFIMVATNRPFDLDDAVLRRLPRRLLVDLPTEKDREAILRIHLKDEVLEPTVSLSHLAAQTPFYSGSDLKNLAVAAALACVREETDAAAAAATGRDEHGEHPHPHQYPDRRILCPRHFDKALEEISASISEDMSSLAAIRKFDEKYGDRKGRRKKRAGFGFGVPADAQSVVETGRVRN
ncbi:MAG: hypothetical protein M1826_007472 [Phylliscum demangeonii]|nr:MAG: hypothetical protein M1826_007472 [Phylliscum demangeonii]